MHRVPFEKPIASKLVNDFPHFFSYTHQRPTPVHVLSQIIPVHSPYYFSWRSILIFSLHLRLGLPSGLFTSGFPIKTFYASLLSPTHSTCPTRLILQVLISHIIFCGPNRPLSSSQTPSMYIHPVGRKPNLHPRAPKTNL
jgi:hypothetical protein